MLKKLSTALAAAVLSAGLVAAGALPAGATPVAVPAAKSTPKVTISKIKNISAGDDYEATIKPSVKAYGNAKITSKKLTVSQGGKTLAYKVKQASLEPGKYTVTTYAKYKTWTTKKIRLKAGTKQLVSDGSKLVRMNCKVSDVETHWMNGFEIELMFLSCTGKFDGVYKARAGYFPYTDDNIYYGVAGENLWGDSFPSQPRIRPIIGGKFTTNVYPLERKVYRTLKKAETIEKRIYSKEKTKTLRQTVTVTE
ncbi:hypothetical protein ACFQ36_05525 [Arthrobacter sp. GCM10027362]|uniref:hypothetical protein n=1 Tax=Arthrobacter sp. GCM10027362 TaxID=3273379 RepID=UPI003637DDF9